MRDLYLVQQKRGRWRAQRFHRRGRRVSPAGWIASSSWPDVRAAVLDGFSTTAKGRNEDDHGNERKRNR